MELETAKQIIEIQMFKYCEILLFSDDIAAMKILIEKRQRTEDQS
jgi:hypothetical protein